MRISTFEPAPGVSPERLRTFLDAEAVRLGFDLVAVASPGGIPLAPARLRRFLAEGRHGSMNWLADTESRRASPAGLWPEAKSIVVLAMNYGPAHDPRQVLEEKDRAAISVYAQNRDYHEVIKGKLKELAQKFASRSGAEVKVFVDTAPVMEKPLAEAAGLGWQGKHTNLVSKRYGSWLFLGSIFTTAALAPDESESDHCGSCRACLDSCPTRAFPAPYQLDARRCLSYLTIENKGPIPVEFRKAMGNRIYGCDDCLAACPWNKFAREASEARLQARADLIAPEIAELLALDDPAFRSRFAGSPVKRIGRDRFLRNVLIAAGNSGGRDARIAAACESLARDASPLVRGAAVWALSQLVEPARFRALAAEALPHETDDGVRSEWLSHEHLEFACAS